jgi:hypothetical protein
MEDQEFETVWYLPGENNLRDRRLLAYEDVGKLSVRGSSLIFKGRVGVLFIADVRQVSYGKQGRDFINSWVKVEYGAGSTASTAYFADGRLRGWSGIFGGTRKIFHAVRG